MRRTIIMIMGVACTTLLGCSGGAVSPTPYTTGRPVGDDDDDDQTETEGETSIDLDGGQLPDDDTGAPPPNGGHGSCCEDNGSPGCENTAVELCVCASDPWCCDAVWDFACAMLIEQLECGHCGGADDDDGGVPPPPPGGGTGGEPPPPPGGTGDEPPPPPDGDGDCCADNGTPGCDDPAVQACVCTSDSYCCDMEWDAVCAAEVESLGCGTCGGGGETGGGGGVSPCCAQQPGAGCAPDPVVEACVCAMDDYCCSTFWDLTCAGEVESFGCGSCS
ncbi:MAG: hypothetical protein AB1Z98_27440 [Nannocystaceae bacterium]